MNNLKISSCIFIIFLAGCASPGASIWNESDVLVANNQLIRFAYELESSSLESVKKYAVEYCESINSEAVEGVRTCDGQRCEITFFCERAQN